MLTGRMGSLVNGQWTQGGFGSDSTGRFVRPNTTFRDWIRADGSSGFAPESGRYHLYVSYACPWAHRVLLHRKLLGLEDAISLSIVDEHMGGDGWFFSSNPGCIEDTVNGAKFLREIYQKADPECTARVTVPILWDKQTNTIVNNESRELIRMFNTEMGALTEGAPDYCPADSRDEIDRVITAIYEPINNGVYRSGFARKQAPYEEAVKELFAALDHWEGVLGHQRYLVGSTITEADWCMFPTLLRFDPVYHYHFKCNLRRIEDYPNLSNYLRDLYQVPGVVDTINLDHVKNHYYGSHETVNPTRVVPLGPPIALDRPHDRGRFA